MKACSFTSPTFCLKNTRNGLWKSKQLFSFYTIKLLSLNVLYFGWGTKRNFIKNCDSSLRSRFIQYIYTTISSQLLMALPDAYILANHSGQMMYVICNVYICLIILYYRIDINCNVYKHTHTHSIILILLIIYILPIIILN